MSGLACSRRFFPACRVPAGIANQVDRYQLAMHEPWQTSLLFNFLPCERRAQAGLPILFKCLQRRIAVTKANHMNLASADIPYADALAKNPFFALSSMIASVYVDAMRQNIEQLAVSSTRIMQEQGIQAWTKAAQSCTEALVHNAVTTQEQALGRITRANQKVFEIVSNGMSR
jgi:hypothetical protein